jgi:hypothetical protein
MIRIAFVTLALAACGGGATHQATPPATPATETSPSPTKKAASEETAPSTASPPSTSKAAAATPEVEPEAEKCEGGWVCFKVSFDTKTVEKRPTKLIGDPKIPETWSKTSDGRTVSFDDFSKGPVELWLKRKPGDKNEVLVKVGKTELVVDKKDGTPDDFTHVGAVAAEQDGAFLVDLKYMK